MSRKALGKTFDIHGGGSDLQFPHHENEIAQSEAANGCLYAKYWLHSGMVQVDKEKMSKSLGNFFTIREVLAQYPAEVVRFFFVTSHYRSQLNYSQENLDNAKAALERLYHALKGMELVDVELDKQSHFYQRFIDAMNDDFNTPEAMAVLFEMVKEVNRVKESDMVKAQQLATQLKSLAAVLGILQQHPEAFLQGNVDDAERIEGLIEERNQARKDRNFARADEIRDQLLAEGIELEDSREGTSWRRA